MPKLIKKSWTVSIFEVFHYTRNIPCVISSATPTSAPRAQANSEQCRDGEQSSDVAKDRVVRTKNADKGPQKFRIDLDAILRGEDNRTTVMVRHLQGLCARKDFLQFLDKCSLGNRYSFFYMPCKDRSRAS